MPATDLVPVRTTTTPAVSRGPRPNILAAVSLAAPTVAGIATAAVTGSARWCCAGGATSGSGGPAPSG